MRFGGLLAAVAYGSTSIAIVFVNKAIFQVYGFKYSNLLTLAQMVFSLVALSVAKRKGTITFPDFSPEIATAVFPLSLSFVGMVLTGLAALMYVNVPMYSALRRFTTLVVMVVQFLMIGKTVTLFEMLATMMMLVGALVAGYGDLTYDLLGYGLVALNCGVTACYLVLIAKVSKETQLSTFGLMFYNNLLSAPVVLLVVLALDWEGVVYLFSGQAPFTFLCMFGLSAVQAFMLNYFIYLCSTMNSPLATSITGQIKSIVTTVYGLVAFGDVETTPALLVGLSISTFGGLWYGKVKYDQSNAKNNTVHSRSQRV